MNLTRPPTIIGRLPTRRRAGLQRGRGPDRSRFARREFVDQRSRPSATGIGLVDHDRESIDLAPKHLDLVVVADQPVAQDTCSYGLVGSGVVGGMAALAGGLVLQQSGDLGGRGAGGGAR